MKFLIQKIKYNKSDYPIVAESEFQADAQRRPVEQVFESIDQGYALWAPGAPEYRRFVHTLGDRCWGADLFDGEHIIEVRVLAEPKAKSLSEQQLQFLGTPKKKLNQTLAVLANVYKSIESERCVGNVASHA